MRICVSCICVSVCVCVKVCVCFVLTYLSYGPNISGVMLHGGTHLCQLRVLLLELILCLLELLLSNVKVD